MIRNAHLVRKPVKLQKMNLVDPKLVLVKVLVVLENALPLALVVNAGGENPCSDAPTKEEIELHGSGEIERYTNINDSLQPSRFPVTGTDQIGLSRMLKINALNAKMSASQQANGCTNNGGGIAF